jgi:DNA-binding beta-propeller fold protein YncE
VLASLSAGFALAPVSAIAASTPSTLQTVWRFHNARTSGSYLWTASVDEKASIVRYKNKTWKFDGPVFDIDTSNNLNTTPLWRFRNKKNGTYLYTSSTSERATLIKNHKTWVQDGLAWNVSAVKTSMPVWRFKNAKNGAHYWTNNAAENKKLTTNKTLKKTWKPQGVAYYLAPGWSQPNVPDPGIGFLLNGRQLVPAGEQVALGNFPTGGAVTADGRFLWTVSAGFGNNDIRIVDTTTRQVIQTIAVPGASGGIALDSPHQLAYLSGLTVSRWLPSQSNRLGASGSCVLVYGWSTATGQAHLIRSIPVPPPADSPPVQAFSVTRYNETTTGVSWPQRLAVSPDGHRLLVPLNLADCAAVVSVNSSAGAKYVKTGSFPYGAAIQPDGRIGFVSNEASGSLSVIDMRSGTKVQDIQVGPPLSHPQGIAIDPTGAYAYVALSTLDQVVVVDLSTWSVVRTISLARSAGLGTMPVALSTSPDGSRLYVAESGADALAVIYLPSPSTPRGLEWTVLGHIPTSEDPQAVLATPAQAGRAAQLLYVSARGTGIGPNTTGPAPTLPSDPIFWAFNFMLPTTDVFSPTTGITYMPSIVTGRAGLMALPSDAQVKQLTPAALRQIQPIGAQTPPINTPVRANGPIKHVFFIVRENRSYDQLLGDDTRGDGSSELTIFGENVTPNLHSLVKRFPLLDHVYANSEASIQGHFWTAAATVPDYVDRNWVQQYAARGRPNDFGMCSVSWPGNGFLFDQAQRQGISYFNYGEGIAGANPEQVDRNRSAAQLAAEQLIAANSDLGPVLTATSTIPFYASDLSIGQSFNANPADPLDGEVFDSSLASVTSPAPPGAFSHVDSFRARFAQQVASNSVPTLNYLCLTSDHTRGTQTNFPQPASMVADSDQAVGQIVETISHSPVWATSAIFVVEDDAQDSADHVDAHRIPIAVISPYALPGAVIHTRYDLSSVTRTMEIIMGMDPLALNDGVASPMYDVFSAQPLNPEPVDAIPANLDLQARNTSAAPWAALSNSLPFNRLDAVPQATLDAILWKSVKGIDSTPPPPGPNAEGEGAEKAGDAD